MSGKVYLVGSGPGDPELLTLKAVGILKESDVVLYDNLIDESILERAGKAEKIYVGKKPGESDKQKEINETLLEKARDDKKVCRLKGGNPIIFGRGGEEYRYLKKRSIDVEIIPGLSSATSIAPLIGIPLTRRGTSSSLSILTGYGAGGSDPDWECVGDTAVVLMTLCNLSIVVEKLKDSGMDENKLGALVSSGSRENQKLVVSQLSRIEELKKVGQIKSPALLIAGDVVKESLRFEGSKISIFRPSEKKETTESLIKKAGAIPQVYEICEMTPSEELEETLLGNWDLIIFMSTEGVKAASRITDLSKVKAVAVGGKTAEKLKECGCKKISVPEEQNSKGINKLLKNLASEKGNSDFLALRSSMADQRINKAENIEAYKVKPKKEEINEIIKSYESNPPEYTVLTSSGMLRLILDHLRKEKRESLRCHLNNSFVVSVGRKCTNFAVSQGINVNYEMKEPNLEKLFGVSCSNGSQ